MLKILIADDSALMRKYLGDIFKDEGDFELCMARNGAEALALANSFKPDVMTLDVNMPEMDGITCLSRIMVECPVPVVMVSSLTSRDAEVTLQALGLGAVDFIPKPDGTVSLHIDKIRHALVTKVRAAARAKPRGSRFLAERVRRASEQAQPAGRQMTEGPAAHAPVAKGQPRGLVLIGVSTGGPGALEAILPRLPKHFPWPIVVAQHMPESFTGVFARSQNRPKSRPARFSSPAATRIYWSAGAPARSASSRCRPPSIISGTPASSGWSSARWSMCRRRIWLGCC